MEYISFFQIDTLEFWPLECAKELQPIASFHVETVENLPSEECILRSILEALLVINVRSDNKMAICDFVTRSIKLMDRYLYGNWPQMILTFELDIDYAQILLYGKIKSSINQVHHLETDFRLRVGSSWIEITDWLVIGKILVWFLPFL